jgi:CIC family chloride channel protein
MLTLGATIGLACGGLAEHLTGHVPTTFVFAGMGAFVAGCSRTPITAVFLAFALTKDLLILKPILVACLASFLVTQVLHGQSIYERQIELLRAFDANGKGTAAAHHSIAEPSNSST